MYQQHINAPKGISIPDNCQFTSHISQPFQIKDKGDNTHPQKYYSIKNQNIISHLKGLIKKLLKDETFLRVENSQKCGVVVVTLNPESRIFEKIPEGKEIKILQSISIVLSEEFQKNVFSPEEEIRIPISDLLNSSENCTGNDIQRTYFIQFDRRQRQLKKKNDKLLYLSALMACVSAKTGKGILTNLKDRFPIFVCDLLFASISAKEEEQQVKICKNKDDKVVLTLFKKMKTHKIETDQQIQKEKDEEIKKESIQTSQNNQNMSVEQEQYYITLEQQHYYQYYLQNQMVLQQTFYQNNNWNNCQMAQFQQGQVNCYVTGNFNYENFQKDTDPILIREYLPPRYQKKIYKSELNRRQRRRKEMKY